VPNQENRGGEHPDHRNIDPVIHSSDPFRISPHWGMASSAPRAKIGTEITRLSPQGAALDNRRGRLSLQPERPKNFVQNASEQ